MNASTKTQILKSEMEQVGANDKHEVEGLKILEWAVMTRLDSFPHGKVGEIKAKYQENKKEGIDRYIKVSVKINSIGLMGFDLEKILEMATHLKLHLNCIWRSNDGFELSLLRKLKK